MSELLALSHFRSHIEAALSHGSATHTYEDVAEMVAAGHAQFWPGPASVVVTETIAHPQAKRLHFFLAAGVRRELEAMTPGILDWGRSVGCTRATLMGRKGWTRTFLKDTGWNASDLVLMEKAL